MKLLGVDFTSAPSRRKPIVVAHGSLQHARVVLEHFELISDWADFDALLHRVGPWLGAFDFPFGLPREAVRDLGWPEPWAALVQHCASLGRERFRKLLDDYRMRRPPGQRYAHRATDHPARSHSPLKLVNPPVGLMFLEGTPRLLAAGVHLPGLRDGDRSRIALEAYPGYLARAIERASYKGDGAAACTPERHAARARLLSALACGAHPLGLSLTLSADLHAETLSDARGDRLDAALALLQAASSATRATAGFGLPATIDPLEGWIATVPTPSGGSR